MLQGGGWARLSRTAATDRKNALFAALPQERRATAHGPKHEIAGVAGSWQTRQKEHHIFG
jgi:hypothetical protein